jgi:hypothetical protein
MQQSDHPSRFPIPFGASAGASYIRTIPTDPVTPSGSDAPASLTEGFPPECFLPESSGGIPPNGKDFNGILNQITAMCRWLAAGGPAVYNSAFATAIGGYPKGARLTSTSNPGLEWISTADNNLTDPGGGSAANWVRATPYRILKEGTLIGTLVAGTQYTITFPQPFPTACSSFSLTPINGTGAASRDNWLQRVSYDRFGITFLCQGSLTGGDNTLDGADWLAHGY